MKKNDRRPVRFIRRNGRIIPIHIREGAQQAALGTAIGVATGAVSAGLVKVPEKAHAWSRRQIWKRTTQEKFFNRLLSTPKSQPAQASFADNALGYAKGIAKPKSFSQTVRLTARVRKAAAFAPKLATPTFLIGAGLASAAFAASASNFQNKRRATVKNALVQDAASLGGFVVAGSTFLRLQGVKPLAKAVRQTLSLVPDFLKRTKGKRPPGV